MKKDDDDETRQAGKTGKCCFVGGREIVEWETSCFLNVDVEGHACVTK